MDDQSVSVSLPGKALRYPEIRTWHVKKYDHKAEQWTHISVSGHYLSFSNGVAICYLYELAVGVFATYDFIECVSMPSDESEVPNGAA